MFEGLHRTQESESYLIRHAPVEAAFTEIGHTQLQRHVQQQG